MDTISAMVAKPAGAGGAGAYREPAARDRVVRETAPSLREMAPGERPQERLAALGPGALSDTELLAMLLRSGSKGMDVLKVAGALLAEAGSLAELMAWKAEDFQRVKGIGPVKGLQMLTVMEVARRVVAQAAARAPEDLRTPAAIRRHFAPFLAGLEVEKLWVLCINRKFRLIKRVEITSGTATGSLVHPREVFREAIRHGASGLVLAHNHPSGDPSPSQADMAITKQLREAAEVVGIHLMDHVILGQANIDPAGRGYFSFSEAGLL